MLFFIGIRSRILRNQGSVHRENICTDLRDPSGTLPGGPWGPRMSKLGFFGSQGLFCSLSYLCPISFVATNPT